MPLTQTIRQNARYVLLILLILLTVAAVYFFHEVLLPFFLGIFLAYLLAPVIDWLSRLKISRWSPPRGLSILTVYAVVLGILVLSGAFLFPRFYAEVNRMVHTLPSTLQQLENTFIQPLEDYVNDWIHTLLPEPEPLLSGQELTAAPPRQPPGTVTHASNTPERSPWQVLVEDYTFEVRRIDDSHYEVVPQRRQHQETSNNRQPFQLNRQLSVAVTQMRESLQRNIIDFVVLGRRLMGVLVSSFFMLFLVLMISGFLLLDPSRIHNFARGLFPAHRQHNFDDWLGRMDHGLSGVVRGQAIICLVNGVLTGIGLGLMGVPFVVTLSVMAAVFSLIPIFGVLISTVPILIMSLTVSFTTAILALGWVLVIHFVEGNFLNPKILGDAAKIHPVLIVFALLVGEHFAGVMGALLAVPIFSLIQNSFLFLKHQAESIDAAQ